MAIGARLTSWREADLISARLGELEELDPTGTAFRYPDGVRPRRDQFRAGVARFTRVMGAVLERLEAI